MEIIILIFGGLRDARQLNVHAC